MRANAERGDALAPQPRGSTDNSCRLVAKSQLAGSGVPLRPRKCIFASSLCKCASLCRADSRRRPAKAEPPPFPASRSPRTAAWKRPQSLPFGSHSHSSHSRASPSQPIQGSGSGIVCFAEKNVNYTHADWRAVSGAECVFQRTLVRGR